MVSLHSLVLSMHDFSVAAEVLEPVESHLQKGGEKQCGKKAGHQHVGKAEQGTTERQKVPEQKVAEQGTTGKEQEVAEQGTTEMEQKVPEHGVPEEQEKNDSGIGLEPAGDGADSDFENKG